MKFYSKALSVACLLCVVLIGTTAFAGWELYDDFSSGSIDTNKWFNVGDSQTGVTWSVVNGKLRVTKVAGDVNADSAQYLASMPAGGNGLKADVALVSNSGVMRMQLEVRVDASQQSFGTATLYDAEARFRNQLGTYTWNDGNSFGLYNDGHYLVRAVDDDTLENEFGRTQVFLNDGTELSDTHTLSVQVSEAQGYLETAGGRSTLLQERSDGGALSNMLVRLKFFGNADAACVVDIDNVYVHTGALETGGASGPAKVVVIPF